MAVKPHRRDLTEDDSMKLRHAKLKPKLLSEIETTENESKLSWNQVSLAPKILQKKNTPLHNKATNPANWGKQYIERFEDMSMGAVPEGEIAKRQWKDDANSWGDDEMWDLWRRSNGESIDNRLKWISVKLGCIEYVQRLITDPS